MPPEPIAADVTVLVTWLQKLCDDIDALLRLLSEQPEWGLPDRPARFDLALNARMVEFLQRRQRQRLQALGLHTNALVVLTGNHELGGRVQVNTRQAELSPAEFPFLLILAQDMQKHLDADARLGAGFVTKHTLVERVQEQLRLRRIRTAFHPEAEHVRIYIRRIRRKLDKAGIDPRLVETQTRLGGYRLSTLPEHIEIVQAESVD